MGDRDSLKALNKELNKNIKNALSGYSVEKEIEKMVYGYIQKSEDDKKRLKKRWIWKCIFIALAIGLIFIAIYFTRDITAPLFFNNKGEFQWIGITSVGVFITLIVTVIENTKKNRSDTIRRARIEWIQIVRKDISEFVSLCNEYADYILYSENEITVDMTMSKMHEISKIENLLYLYIHPDSADNKKLYDKIKLLAKTCSELSETRNRRKVRLTSQELAFFASYYFKKEWIASKKNQ